MQIRPFLLAAALMSGAALGADPHACDLIDERLAAEILGSPITSPPSRRPMVDGSAQVGSVCNYFSIVSGRAQHLQIELQVFKSAAQAKADMDPEFEPDKDASEQTSRESGVGDQAFYRYFAKENKGIFVFRKGNRIVVMQAGGSGFKMTPAYQSTLRKIAIRILGKL